MKRNLIIIPILCLALCSCTAEPEQTEQPATTTTSVLYETMIAPEIIKPEETTPEILEANGIVAEEKTVLNERQRIALVWAEEILAEWFKTTLGQNICGENVPEITAITADGKVQAICDGKTLCFESDENNQLKFVGYNENYISENENMLEVSE